MFHLRLAPTCKACIAYRALVAGVFITFIISGLVPHRVSAATVTVRPNGDVTAQWGAGGTSDGTCSGAHCSRVDEALPNTADYVDTPLLLGNGLTELFEMDTAPVGQVVTQITIRTYARAALALPPLDIMDTITPSLWIDGAFVSGAAISATTSWGWYDRTFSGSWDQADIDAMRVRYVNNVLGLGLNVLQLATSEAVLTYTPDPAYNQSAYRWFANADSLAPGAAAGAINSPVEVSAGSAFRLRMAIGVSGQTLLAGSHNYRLQYAAKSGSCSASFASGGTDLTGSGILQLYNNPAVSSGQAVASSGGDPSAGGTTVYQTYQESNPFTNSSNVTSSNGALWDFALQSQSAAVGNTYCFRMVRQSGQVLDTYTNFPELTVVGSLNTDWVDAAGLPTSDGVAFPATASIGYCQANPAVLGSPGAKLRITNDVSTTGWSASIAPTSGAAATWADSTHSFDVNDTAICSDSGDGDSVGGLLAVNPGPASISPEPGCSAAGLSLGSADWFDEGTTDAISLVSASSLAQRFCYWDIEDIGLLQYIPAGTPAGSYTLDLTVTIVAL